MTTIHKEYTQPFVLEPTKLTRIFDKMQERLKLHDPTITRNSFEVFMTANRREELKTLEEVLALDNSRAKRIERLIVTCAAGRKVATSLEHEIQIDFGRQITRGSANDKATVLTVRSDSTGWASSTLSDLEEQVERTKQRHMPSILMVASICVISLVVLFFQIVPLAAQTTDQLQRSMWLRDSDLSRVEQLLNQNKTLTDEAVREVFTIQLRNFRDNTKPLEPRPIRQTLLISLPLVAVAICGFFIIATCYPTAVFLWGDEVNRYENVLSRRKTLWSAIISIAVLGVMSRFFATALMSWLPQ